MKTMIGATFAIALAAFAAPALAGSTPKTATSAAPKAIDAEAVPASLDERLGCGVLLVTIDEVLRRNPELAAKFSNGDKGSSMMPMFRLLGASGGAMLDEAYTEGATQGLTPTALYRRGVADLSAKFAQSGKDQAMAVIGRCMQVATPES